MAEPTALELQRAQRIRENQRKLEEMGLLAASRGLATAAAAAVTLQAGSEQQPRCKRRRAEPAAPAALEPTRLSRRLRGEVAPTLDEAAAAARAEAEAEGRARARAGGARKQLLLEPGQALAAPFTLWSIGVTVWELGHVHRGAWAHRYWSSPGCLFHHAYPVGYRATKVHFGRTYEMQIEEGTTGPVFKVVDQQSGAVFSGASPTKPWTDVCIAHRTGQRISGPLFFGFSDHITQRAIAANLYTEGELRAALQGERLESHSDSHEEQVARELCSVDGVGEATAILLARTTALGGSMHSGLDSLRAWASTSEENAQALLAFLTGSEEVPESTRRWPAWQQRVAPRIVLALAGRWLGSGPSPAAAADAEVAEAGPEAGREEEAGPRTEAEAGPGPEPDAQAEAEAQAASEQDVDPASEAAGGCVAAPAPGRAAAGDGEPGARAQRRDGAGSSACGHERRLEQQQQQQARVTKGQDAPQGPVAASAPAGSACHAVPQAAQGPKENVQPRNGSAAGPALAAQGPAPQRSSRRERRATTKLEGYLTEEGGGAGREEL